MTAPTLIEVTNHLREHYSLTMAELLTIMRTPMHPAGLRDEFAVAAMQGLLAHRGMVCAKDAYEVADAMLETRNANR